MPADANPELEIKDAHLIFAAAWQDLEAKFGRDNLVFPRETIWLGGAPGSGKGTNTPFIMDARGITAPPIVTSALLDSPTARAIKDRGQMVGDREVVNLLLETLLDPEYRVGVVVDGFPRTGVQVTCLKLFYHKLLELHEEFSEGASADEHPRPMFQIALLFVEERTSIQRQLQRGREISAHNQLVRESGEGQLLELRVTDQEESAARNRYRVFKETTFSALKSLRKVFHYHFIDAGGDLHEVQLNIADEFRYQSSLELEPETYGRIQQVPLARQIVQHARQKLIERLESYEHFHAPLFAKVIEIITTKFMPIIEKYAVVGQCQINSEDDTFDDPLALAMLIDIFAERGYAVIIDIRRETIPVRVNPETWEIETRQKRVFRIKVRFKGSEIRRGLH
jgi:adenylate kinase